MFFPDGTFISGEYLTTIFDDFPDAVNAFQVVQLSDYSLTVKVVPNREFHDFPKVCEQVRETLTYKVRGQVPVFLKIVDKIPDDKGKLRFVVHEIK